MYRFKQINIACLLLLLFSCKEKGVIVDFDNRIKEETTYVTNPETAQAKTVLIEEFTGVSCPPCPAGHDAVKAIKNQHSNKIVVVAYHILNFSQADPIKNLSKQDFRTQVATDVGNTIYQGVSLMPAAGIDRTPVNGQMLLNRTIWANAVNEQVAKLSYLNIHMNSVYDPALKEATLNVKIAFTQAVSKKLCLNICVIEDSIIDAQKTLFTIDTFYTHNYVLRDLISPLNGIPFLDDISTKEAGRVYERTVKFNLKDLWNADRCKVVAYVSVNESPNVEVLQAAWIKLN
jgi:thiol-disulfide isomerase/thioredoxin